MYIKKIKIENSAKKDDAELPYYLSLPAVQDVQNRQEGLVLKQPVSFFVGENGSGKSTFLEAIAVCAGFNPEGGTKNFNFSTFNSHAGLWEDITLSRGLVREKDGFFLRAESYYNVASEIERLDEGVPLPALNYWYGGKSLHEQSHGESFMAVVLHRFGGKGLYILDEPEAALSPTNQLALLARIHELAEDNSQFIIATHSPILMAYPDAEIYEFSNKGIETTQYTQTAHYQITKRFLENPKAMLNVLFEN